MEHTGQLIFMMWVEHESRLESIRVATSNKYLNGELNRILGREVDVGIAVRSIVRQGKLVMISTGPYGCILAKAAHLTVPACDQSAVEAAPGKILEAMVAPEIVAGALLAAVPLNGEFLVESVLCLFPSPIRLFLNTYQKISRASCIHKDLFQFTRGMQSKYRNYQPSRAAVPGLVLTSSLLDLLANARLSRGKSW